MALYTSWYVQPISAAKLLKMPGFYAAFIFSFALTLVIFLLARMNNNYLNKHYKWLNGKEKRWAIQVASGILGIAMIDYGVVRAYFWLFEIDFSKSGFMDIEFPMTVVLLITLNMLYMVQEMSPTYFGVRSLNNYAQVLEAHIMNKQFLVHIDNVVCLKREGNIGFLWDNNDTLYNIDYKMEELNNMLNPSMFVQISRSEIFALKYIAGFDNKNASIILKQAIFQVEGKISRNRYKAFVKSFTTYQQSEAEVEISNMTSRQA